MTTPIPREAMTQEEVEALKEEARSVLAYEESCEGDGKHHQMVEIKSEEFPLLHWAKENLPKILAALEEKGEAQARLDEWLEYFQCSSPHDTFAQRPHESALGAEQVRNNRLENENVELRRQVEELKAEKELQQRVGLQPPVIEMCDLEHRYFKEAGSHQRCPHCLIVGLEVARNDCQQLTVSLTAEKERAEKAERERDEAREKAKEFATALFYHTGRHVGSEWYADFEYDEEGQKAAEYLVSLGLAEKAKNGHFRLVEKGEG